MAAAQVGGGEGKVSAIELPAAAVAVADGFQELEWLLLAGTLAPMQSKCPQESAAERGSSLFLHQGRSCSLLEQCAAASESHASSCLLSKP